MKHLKGVGWGMLCLTVAGFSHPGPRAWCVLNEKVSESALARP